MKHFLIEITYAAPLPEVERVTPAHRAFLQTHYDAGTLLFSGPQQPRTGGLVIGRAESLEAFQALMADDPFVREGVARHRFVEFVPVKRQPLLDEWMG